MTNLFGFLAPVMMAIGGIAREPFDTVGPYFPHRKDTPLSKRPHIETPKPLTKRQKRRAKGRKL